MPRIELAAEKLFDLFGLPVTNALLTSWIVVLVLIVLVMAIRRVRMIPSGLQNVFEMFVEGFLGLMEGIFGSRQQAEKYFPLVGTIFLFVLASNWLGIFPGVGSIQFIRDAHERLPLFRSAASDLNFTLALGIVAVFFVNISGASALGVKKHLSKFFTIRNPIESFVGILEFVSEFAKIISFSFRLFGNVFAGEVLLAITAFVAQVLTPASLASYQSGVMALALMPFLGLEIFVGLVQALVFAMLTMVFVSIAVAHHEKLS